MARLIPCAALLLLLMVLPGCHVMARLEGLEDGMGRLREDLSEPGGLRDVLSGLETTLTDEDQGIVQELRAAKGAMNRVHAELVGEGKGDHGQLEAMGREIRRLQNTVQRTTREMQKLDRTNKQLLAAAGSVEDLLVQAVDGMAHYGLIFVVSLPLCTLAILVVMRAALRPARVPRPESRPSPQVTGVYAS